MGNTVLAAFIFLIHILWTLCMAAQMENIVVFSAQPPMSLAILYTLQLRGVLLWTCCATRDYGDAKTTVPSAVTQVTIPKMIWIKILPRAGWASKVV